MGQGVLGSRPGTLGRAVGEPVVDDGGLRAFLISGFGGWGGFAVPEDRGLIFFMASDAG
jgi:hypothetical protein